MRELIATMYQYNEWANERILDTTARLGSDDYRADHGASFGSVHDTLVHIVDVQWLWLSRWQGTSPRALPSPEAFADLLAGRRRWAEIDRDTREFVAALIRPEQLDRIVEYINTEGEGSILRSGEDWETVALPRLRFRALVEVLLGTGARISEILALDRRDIDFQRREAKTIGEGNKQRVLFFTVRALEWLQRYLSRRRDDEEALFVTRGDRPHRLAYDAVKHVFKHVTRRAHLSKKVSAHILRHTMATTLLFNGCPIGHIKELLGHERLDTTCRYYLAIDVRAAKDAHERFLTYERWAEGLGTNRVAVVDSLIIYQRSEIQGLALSPSRLAASRAPPARGSRIGAQLMPPALVRARATALEALGSPDLTDEAELPRSLSSTSVTI
jgi:integrase/recombinase XerD